MSGDIDRQAEAKFWDVTSETIRKWINAGHPVSDHKEMARVIMSFQRPHLPSLAVARKVLEDEPAQLSLVDFDSADLEDINNYQARAYFWAKYRSHEEQGQLTLAEYYFKKYQEIGKTIRADEDHARKMGIDEGRIISREQLDSWIFAFAFHCVRGIEADVKHMASEIKRRIELGDSDFDLENDTREQLDRFFMRRRFLTPFAKSVQDDSGVSLPKWVFEIIQNAVETFFEVDPQDDDDVAAFAKFKAALMNRERNAV